MHRLLTFDSDTLTIRPWADEVIDRLGFDPRSPYVERFWLGVLGPSTTWLLRRFAAAFDCDPEGFELPLSDTARALGLGDRGGRHSPFLRSLNRSVQFEMAQVLGSRELAVRRYLPPLSRRHLVRLGPALQEEHQRFIERTAAEPDRATKQRRSRQLALSLLELGEDREETERQLLRWGYDPALASEASAWAWGRHCSALQAAQSG
ncbi:MAG: hypothetical protein J2P58_08925 [Acidimicrobiaceae bacterium]|nr:hypothetical protein [Acidimicrobiaceae bacterium]